MGAADGDAGRAPAGAIVRRLRPDEWRQLRDLRLRALADAPDAFGATLAHESAFADEKWQERAARDDRITVVAEHDGRLVGMASGGPAPVDGRVAGLFGMWVEPAARGTGVAEAIVARVMDWARQLGYETLALGVTTTNARAISLYERLGFEDTGERHPLREGSELGIQIMSLSLGRRGGRRVFLAGAGGAIGRLLTPMLVDAGHRVTGTTRSPDRAAAIRAAGATPVVVDVLDGGRLADAVAEARPEVVIHQLTSLALAPGEQLGDAHLERNAHLREAGTWNLVEAAVAAGARRVIAQSIAWLYLPGPEPHTEDESIVPPEPAAISTSRRGVIELERLVTADPRFEGIVLRYGRLYGPGTWATEPPEPPTVHVAAAALAAALAVERGEPGIYHVADDGGPVSTERARRLLGWTP